MELSSNLPLRDLIRTRRPSTVSSDIQSHQNDPVRIAHVVNIFNCPEDSEAQRIQAITLESMKRAKHEAGPGVEVEFLSAQFPTDRDAVPDFFRCTPDLERSVQDDVECSDKRKLPYIHDILSRAFDTSDADFLLYTNMDIALYPGFYRFIANKIRRGIDALAINRAQIPRVYKGRDLLTDATLDEILLVKNLQPHQGIDCVMFPRERFPQWPRTRICIGYPPVGQYLLENAEVWSNRFVWYRDVVQTCHVGIDGKANSPWKKYFGNEICTSNYAEFEACRRYKNSAWQRHGDTHLVWAMRRGRWLLRSWLPFGSNK